MRCCANCEWSISLELEDEIMKEQGYSVDDVDRPIAGDCALGNIARDDFVCSNHLYSDGTEEVYCFSNRLNELFIVQMINDEIDKFLEFKLSHFGEPFQLFIRGYELGVEDAQDVSFSVYSNQKISKIFACFREKLNQDNVYSTLQSEDYLGVRCYDDDVVISVHQESKTIDNSFVDISFECFETTSFYEAVLELFHDLSEVFCTDIYGEDEKMLMLLK